MIGGDLVVHQGARAVAGRQPDPQGAARPLGRTRWSAAVRLAHQHSLPLGRPAAIDNQRTSDEEPARLVVDALAGDTAPGLGGRHRWSSGRRDAQPALHLRRRRDGRRASDAWRASRPSTATGQSLYSGTVPISVTKSGAPYTLTDAAHGNAKTTDMQNKQDSILCTLFGSGCTNGAAYTSPDASFGTGANSNRESRRGRRPLRRGDDVRLLQERSGAQRHLRAGAGAPSRVHYGKKLRQRVLGRHQDDLRRR